MPIHFSIGFVIENRPRTPVEGVCGKAYTEAYVDGIASVQRELSAIASVVSEIICQWDIDMACDKDSGCCGECIDRELLCIGSGNDKTFLFSVFDQDGDEFDISAASEIVFSVSDGVIVGGNITAGGTVRFTKKMSLSEITIAGTGYQFLLDISPSDTDPLVNRDYYWDATVTTSAGKSYTVKSGVFRITKTNAGV